MKRHTCTDCHQSIANGQAYIRSEGFRQVAFCRVCWAIRSVVAKALAA